MTLLQLPAHVGQAGLQAGRAVVEQYLDLSVADAEAVRVADGGGEQAHPVAGRFDAIRSPKGVTAIVDYAHTPDALVNVLNAIHGVLEGKGKVITVVGAGGNRDKGKRPIMAKEAAKASDRVIITSDNPRFEEPQEIINDMLAGLDAEDMKKTLSIADRKEAIRTACMLAEKGDVILVAGKGHENYQEIKGVKHHFDDKEVLKEIFN